MNLRRIHFEYCSPTLAKFDFYNWYLFWRGTTTAAHLGTASPFAECNRNVPVAGYIFDVTQPFCIAIEEFARNLHKFEHA